MIKKIKLNRFLKYRLEKPKSLKRGTARGKFNAKPLRSLSTEHINQVSFYEDLLNKAKKLHDLNQLKNGTKSRLSPLHFYKLMINHCDLIVDFVKAGGPTTKLQLYIFNYDRDVYEPIEHRLNVIINKLSDLFAINNFNQFSNNVYAHLLNHDESSHPYRVANIAPSYIIPFKNKIVNRLGEKIENYHFVTRLAYDFKDIKDCDPILVKIAEQVIKEWSDFDESFELYLYQIIMAVLECNGRQVCHIFESSGGNGKSSFGQILTNLAGPAYTIRANINQYGNSNYVNEINQGTRLIYGDDLSTNTNISGHTIAAAKTLISGIPQQFEVKFQHNRLVQSNAVHIQMTNSKPSIFENSDAMLDRFNYLFWKAVTNYRRNKIVDFNLDKLLGTTTGKPNKDFMEAIIALAFLKVPEYFETFTLPETAKTNMQDVLNNADQVYQFLSDCAASNLFLNECVPYNYLYDYYSTTWIKQNNPGSKPLSNKSFVVRVQQLADKFKFELTDARSRIASLELNGTFSRSFMTNYISYNCQLKPNIMTKYLHFKDNEISIADIEELESKINDFSFEDYLNNAKLQLVANKAVQLDRNMQKYQNIHCYLLDLRVHEVENGN